MHEPRPDDVVEHDVVEQLRTGQVPRDHLAAALETWFAEIADQLTTGYEQARTELELGARHLAAESGAVVVPAELTFRGPDGAVYRRVHPADLEG